MQEKLFEKTRLQKTLCSWNNGRDVITVKPRQSRILHGTWVPVSILPVVNEILLVSSQLEMWQVYNPDNKRNLIQHLDSYIAVALHRNLMEENKLKATLSVVLF
jgi:hypothetical protein